LVFITSSSPLAALMFMNNAAPRFMTSALGFNDLSEAILVYKADPLATRKMFGYFGQEKVFCQALQSNDLRRTKIDKSTTSSPKAQKHMKKGTFED
jgi:hypothetical protein